MSLKRISKNARLSAAIAISLFSASVSTVYALPTGGEVQSGEAHITAGENRVDIEQKTDRVAIDWTSFNIANGETVNFNQPGTDSIALNRVTGNDVSQIYGSLTANGKVFLINPHGVLFGRGAQVDVGGLVASTANVSDQFMKDFGGSTGNFDLSIEDTNKAAIINQATINAKIKEQGGLVVLHAANVENDGTIQTVNGGTVQLAAGKNLTVNFDSAKINFTVDGGLSEANVLNAGTISAQNGLIAMTARGANEVLSSVVNTDNAKLEAKGLALNEKGEIVLDAGTGITAISGTVDVSGKEGADGGNITVNSGNVYVDAKELNASGANGGNITMNTGKIYVADGAKIHAEATAENGKNGTWTVKTTNTIDSWATGKEQLAEAKKVLAAAKADVEKQLETAQKKYAEAEAARAERDKAQAEVERLTKEIAEKTADNQEKQKALETADKALQEANQAVKDAEKAQSEAQGKLDEAQTKLDNANTKQSEANTESIYANYGAQIAADAYNKAKEVTEAAQKALEAAKTALAEATTNQSNAQTAYNNAVTAAETAAQELATANSEKTVVEFYYNWAKSNAETKAQEALTAKQNAEKAQEAYDTVCGFVGTLDKCKTDSERHFYLGYLYDDYLEDFKEAYKNLKEYAPSNLSEGYKQSKAKENGWENFWNGFLSWFNWDYARQHDAAKNTRTMFSDALNYENGVYSAAQQAADSAKTTEEGLYSSLEQADAKVTDKTNANTNAQAALTTATGELNTANTNKTNAENAVTEANTKLGTANKAAEDAKGKAENAQKQANEVTEKLNAANKAVEEATKERDAAKTAKDNADTNVTNANTAQQGAQGAYNNADSALKASNEELTKLDGEKTASEKAVTDNEAARAAAYADSNENLKSVMNAYVEANKAFAEAANAKVDHNNSLISSKVIADTLTNTNVTIVADNETNTADIGLYNNIKQNKGNATNLTFTADRNVIIRGNITSDKELNIVTEAGTEQGNGDRYGATIVYADINTKGDLGVNGNTYVGHYIRGNNSGSNETGSDAHTVGGKIAAKDITFGGDVVLATGGTVNVIADNNVTFNGTINSGNAYAYRMITTAEQKALKEIAAEGTNPNYWEYALKKAAEGNGYVAGESYLATITSDIEDSAVSAVRPNSGGESYVGAKAGEWVENEDGTKTREWKWVTGPDAGKTFYIQTVTKYGKPVSGETVDGCYSNFLEGEPSNTNWKQNVLATEYKNRWDDAFETGNNEGMYYAKYYIQEINVGESSLSINAGKNIELNGQLGDKRSLNGIELKAETAHVSSPITTKGDMTINAALTGKNIALTSTEGSITINKNVTAAKPVRRLLMAVPVNEDGKISLSAGTDVTLNGVLTAENSGNGAVQISAGEAFINKAGENAIQTGGTWQIFSATPEKDEFNGLNSNNTAIWNAKGTVDNGGKNTYSFKYQPTLTVTANDSEKTYGDNGIGSGYEVTSDLIGMKDKNRVDVSNVFTDTTLEPSTFVDGVKLISEGFDTLASCDDYGIGFDEAEASGKNGYGLAFKGGKLTVNPKDVNLNYGGYEIVDSRIKVLDGTPSYDSQIVDGDTTAPKVSYGTTGLGDGLSYGVDYYVNGEKISSGDTVGNYRFNYDDSTVIKLNNPENRRVQTLDMMKMAAALKGNADFDLDLSNAAVEGVEKVAGLMDGQLPGFKVVGQNVVPCGVFEISTTPDAVKVTQKPATAGATAAEPERGANQYRELSKMLDTVDGAANFTLTYNGSRFQIYPDGKEAQALLAKGESEGNVNVAAAALRSAFKEMGLSLEDMDAIYVHMDKDITALYN